MKGSYYQFKMRALGCILQCLQLLYILFYVNIVLNPKRNYKINAIILIKLICYITHWYELQTTLDIIHGIRYSISTKKTNILESHAWHFAILHLILRKMPPHYFRMYLWSEYVIHFFISIPSWTEYYMRRTYLVSLERNFY